MIERGELVDSVCCDPPYHLISIVKRFGAKGSAPAKVGRDGSFARLSRGFMEEKWDGTDANGVAIAHDPELWKLVYQVMKPGAYIVAFAAASTYHRMACAIEDAGFITHPLIGWAYAQGMPKGKSAARAIDKALGYEHAKVFDAITGKEVKPTKYVPITAEAAEWDGYYYGGQVRKPALEPIYVGQKPFSEKNGGLNLLKHGIGAVNIDDLRIGNYFLSQDDEVEGRWPANLIHDGSAEVVALFPESKGARGDVTGTEPSHSGMDGTVCYNEFGRIPSKKRGDHEGSAARFFECYPFEDNPILFEKKAARSERGDSGHPTRKPRALIRSLVRHVTPRGGTVLDPFAGTGTTAEAAALENLSCILMEREAEYCDYIQGRFELTSGQYDFSLIDILGSKLASERDSSGTKVETVLRPETHSGTDLSDLLS